MASVKLSNADAAWLHMEDPTNLMMITGLFLFSAPVRFRRMRDTLEKRLLSYDRFKMKVRSGRVGVKPTWEHDREFDLDHHFQPVTVPEPGDKPALLEVVSRLMSTPLDRDRPLWQLLLVEDFQGGSALICRLHHAIADGIALMKVLLNLTDPAPESASFEGSTQSIRPRRKRQSWESLVKRPRELVDLAGRGLEAAAGLGKILLDSEPATPLKGKLGLEKKAAVSRAVPLDLVKAARQSHGATVNDLLIAALTGALRRYLERRGAKVDNLSIRVVVPVDLRQPHDQELGNRFGLVFLSLPVGIPDPMERLREVKKRMDALKRTPQAAVVLGLLSAVGVVPAELERRVVELFGSKATGVVTNVPGPQQPLFLAGAPISGMMFWVPQSGRLGLGVSILSYAGQVRLGVATDAGLMPDPESLVEDFHDAFEELLAAPVP
ncbi:MAG: wax ester/triacylglycerol synthase family O-acyltransferase [Candidatus Eremiobacterota bacterium]